ncbi:RNA polymerase II subunit A C-terminal domain phosphatase [Coemansia spiralis]|uniref:RNA polymerase II subunit A C-terminal domain phosphatase SSU72 n=1 Tax=Coemansia spiralis TaxID=417178 RepID=A0A9W8L544_9FUNG|nr:RNA polymerase II subunit A C-terminal domain phosphatase [Coemansia spiralis]
MVKFAVICMSNMNRSMEGHFQLKKRGYNVQSYGTGTQVRLPGPTQASANSYNFGTPYAHISNDLRTQAKDDPNLHSHYSRLGLFAMVDRNITVKTAPEKFQNEKMSYDVILTCEERVFDLVCEELLKRAGVKSKPVHVINIDIDDTHKSSLKGGDTIVELAKCIVASKDLERDMDGIIEDVQRRMTHRLLYTMAFY